MSQFRLGRVALFSSLAIGVGTLVLTDTAYGSGTTTTTTSPACTTSTTSTNASSTASSTSNTNASSTTSTTVAASPTTVPLSMLSDPGSSAGAKSMVQVTVGNNPPVWVVLDSGSVGLHVRQGAISSGSGCGVTVPANPTKSQTFNTGYVDGTNIKGVIGTAPVTIGGITTQQIPIGITTWIGCYKNHPHCPTATAMNNPGPTTAEGIMGIGLANPGTGHPPSPLLYLPGAVGQDWSINYSGNSGTLTLGATVPSNAVALPLSSQSGGTNGVNYYSLGNLSVCYQFGSASSVCEPSIFDTGNPSMVLFGGKLASSAPTNKKKRFVTKGTLVTLTSPSGTQLWSFCASSSSAVGSAVSISKGKGTVNPGIGLFYADTVIFDPANGNVYVVVPGSTSGTTGAGTSTTSSTTSTSTSGTTSTTRASSAACTTSTTTTTDTTAAG